MQLETPPTSPPLARPRRVALLKGTLLVTLLSVALLSGTLLVATLGCASESWEGPCREDNDCLFSGADVGKFCKEGLCEFASDGTTTAPNFCLPVINPASEHFGHNRCLAEEKGEVVLLFFGLIA